MFSRRGWRRTSYAKTGRSRHPRNFEERTVWGLAEDDHSRWPDQFHLLNEVKVGRKNEELPEVVVRVVGCARSLSLDRNALSVWRCDPHQEKLHVAPWRLSLLAQIAGNPGVLATKLTGPDLVLNALPRFHVNAGRCGDHQANVAERDRKTINGRSIVGGPDGWCSSNPRETDGA